MKGLLVAGLVGAAIGFALTRPDLITESDLYRAMFPGGAQQQALDLCFRANHEFDRLDPDQRAQCYRQFLPSEALPAGVAPAPLRAANLVDLQQAAGRGHQPPDDVANAQQSARVVHPTTTRLAQ